MRILIIRHGEPDYSIDSLTEKGWREAHLLAEKLCKEKIDKVYCSILGRAKDTAKEFLERSGITAEYCDWLQEIGYMQIADPENPAQMRGMWDLLPRFFCEREELHRKDEWKNSEVFSGTHIARDYDAVCRELDNILAENGYRRRGNMYETSCGNHKTIAFFCHLGAESVLLSHLLNAAPHIFLQNFCVAPTSVTTIFTEERIKGEVSMRCQSLGDVSHLYHGGEEISFAGRFCECFEDDTRH